MTLQEFLNMSGYGPYVWSCYGLTFAVLIGLGINARTGLREEVVRARRRAQAAATDSAAIEGEQT